MHKITQISVSSHTEMVQIPVFTSPLRQLKIPLCSSEQHDTELSSRSCGTGSGALGHGPGGAGPQCEWDSHHHSTRADSAQEMTPTVMVFPLFVYLVSIKILFEKSISVLKGLKPSYKKF